MHVGDVAMEHRISGLAGIDAPAMREAIAEFDKRGRAQFLKQYGISRSSKFYLVFGQRLYDTKALVAAAYFHKPGHKLPHTKFGGGAQTKAVFRRLAQQDDEFAHVFEDELGELHNLSHEYDRIPSGATDLRELGFSKWIALSKFGDLQTGWLPGVYVIASVNSQPVKISVIDERVVYIGETVSQNLSKRLYQLIHSIEGKRGHGGGERLREKGH